MHQALPPQAVAAFPAVWRAVLEPDPEFRHIERADAASNAAGLRDYLIAIDDQPHDPHQVFGRLRWGGQFVYMSRDRGKLAALSRQFAEAGFSLVRGPGFVRTGWRVPLLSPKAHYFIARKTSLIPPREFSDRFTYQVELEQRGGANPDGAAALGTDHWVVRKEVPTFERVLARLQFKTPELPRSVLERRAKKFVEQIFPLFLTREAAFLKIIQRDCPKEYAHRFPRLIDVEKDSKGYVQRLRTTWLRNGGRPLSQIQFARQSAELLHVLHDRIGIIHLDLRMDNMVITERGVGFIDFGSAVRVNENIQGNAVLSTLFGELMRTSQIQRMMDKMSTAGALTSSVIRDAYQQVDKAVDLFYLAVQISHPTANVDLRDLIRHDKSSPEALALSRLTNAILRPADPNRPTYRTARQVLDEIVRIEASLRPRRPPTQHAPAAATVPAEEPTKPKVWIFGA